MTIRKMYPDPRTGLFDYRGTKGNKIDWEMVPMGELFVEEGAQQLARVFVLHALQFHAGLEDWDVRGRQA